MLTVTQLRAFLAVARSGGVQSAAEQLHVSQPSVSAALGALARELGVQLVEREGRGVRLTEAGAAFEPYAAEVLGLLDQGRQAAVEADGTRKARIRVVAVNTAGEYLLPPLIQAYRREHPGAEILLEIGNRATVFERLTSHRADLGVGGRPPGHELDGSPFLDNELIVVGREAVDRSRRRDLAPARGRLRDARQRPSASSPTAGSSRRSSSRSARTARSSRRSQSASASASSRLTRSGASCATGSSSRSRPPGLRSSGPGTCSCREAFRTRPAVQGFCDFLRSARAPEIIEASL